MKILKVLFCNINSLKGVHEIDFQSKPLSTDGLFAITGATGSGKTTILDVITLALYNRIPRIAERISKNSISKAGLLLTRNMPDGYAEVLYECSKGIYRSRWSISSTRNGTLRDYEMEIARGETGTLLDLQRRDVPDKNSELIGLNYDQFVRAIILAQGDFATFLKSRNEERSKLLEQITGGEIYRALGIKAFEMNKLHGQELEDKKRLKHDLQNRLLPEEDFADLIKKLNEAELSLKALSKQQEETQIAIQLKKEIGQAEFNLNTLFKEKQALTQKLESFQSLSGEKLKKNNALIPVKDKLVEWQQQQKRAEEIHHRILRIDTRIKDIESEISGQKTKIGALTNDFESSPMEAISLFEKKLQKIDRLIESRSVQYEEKIGRLNAISEELPFDIDLSDLEELRKSIDLRINNIRSELAKLTGRLEEEDIQNPEGRIAEWREASRNLTQVLKEQEFLDQYIENLKECDEDVKITKETAARLPKQIKEIESKVDQLKKRRDQQKKALDTDRLSASLEEHRNHLINGEPCPLCGSTTHPYAKQKETNIDGLEIEVQNLQEEYQHEYEKLINSRAQFGSINDKMVELDKRKTNVIQAIEQKKLSKDSIARKLPERYQKGNPNENYNQLNMHIEDLEKYSANTSILDKLSRVLEQTTTCISIYSEISKQKESRSKLYNGLDSEKEVSEIRERWASLSSDLKNSSSARKEFGLELETTEAKTEELSRQILPVIKSLQYEDEISAVRDLLSSEEADRLNKEEAAIKMQISQNESKVKLSENALGELRKRDSDSRLEDLQELSEESRIQIESEQEIRDNLLAGKKQQENFLKDIADLDKEILILAKHNEKWNLLNKYIGDAEGKKFSTFAQQLTLYQLIILANRRLVLLNDRYQLDIPGEDEDESLSVIDTHMGDLRRSVKSLSGGETFLISLSLALALSDLASRNIEIQSLFIDEGFGSLDKLTLDQTIDTLEKLQYESGKYIGVISHVEAMQERITTQIKVKQNGQGYSLIDIE